MAPPMVFGVQASICHLEFSIYYGHKLCCSPTPCPVLPTSEVETCWLVHSVSPNVSGNDVNFSLVKSLNNWPQLIWTSQESFILEKVRTTSFILLLGVGSYVCYRIFHHIKCRIANKRKRSTTCKKLYRKRSFSNKYADHVCQDDNFSDISSISNFSSRSSSSSLNEQSSDCRSENEDLAMGISASQPSRHFEFEPVRYSKSSGIVFRRSESTPSSHEVHNNGHRKFVFDHWPALETDDDNKENGFDATASYASADDPFDEACPPNDAASLKGNFSPGSLRQRGIKAEGFWREDQRESTNPQRPTSLIFANSNQLARQFSSESFSLRTDYDWSVSRTFSIDSQISELGPDLQPEAEEIGCVAVEKIETLESELIHLKQTVLDLDAEFVQLQFYKKPPEKCWELTNISQSEEASRESDNSVLKVVQRHKAKMWYKGFLNCTQEEAFEEGVLSKEVRWDLVSKRLLDWDYDTENTFDSGSDFGNSLETDSVEFDTGSAAPNSLEWDSDGLMENNNNNKAVVDEIDAGRKPTIARSTSSSDNSGLIRARSQKRKRFAQRRNSSLESPAHKINRTKSSPSSFLLSQIQQMIASNKSEEPTPSGFSLVSVASESSSSSPPVAILVDEDKRKYKERDSTEEDKGKMCEKDDNGNVNCIQQQTQNTWDSAYCEDSDFLDSPDGSIGEVISVAAYIASTNRNDLSKGYEAVGAKYLQKIRGDKACIIRAALFSLLSRGHTILDSYGGASSVYQALTAWSQTTNPWLTEWTFANRLPYIGPNCLKGFWDCLQSLQEMEQHLKTVQDPGLQLMAAINQDSELDAKLIEAVKLLMTFAGLRLHEDLVEGMGDGGILNIFAMLLFNRTLCSSPRDLVIHEIDKIGVSKILNQVDLYLLGHSLCASLKVVRPHLIDSSGFLTLCPDWNQKLCPEVVLATEDDRNYWLVL